MGIRQVLNHVTDTERAFTFRALWFARGLESPLPSYDQNVAASGAEADTVSWAAHVEEFRRVRLSSISLFANMSSEALMRSGIASDNPFTARPCIHHRWTFSAPLQNPPRAVSVNRPPWRLRGF